jgi:hypothetical protein
MSDEKKLNAWQQYKQNLGDVRPWDLLDPTAEKAVPEEATRRLSICLDCPELIQITKQCKKCLCFMQAKTKLQAAHCPINKW